MKVLVFTMEKVGSTTIMRALESGGHTAGRAYAGNMDQIDWPSYERVVTAVRDPIARNISQHFEVGDPIDNDWPLTWVEKYLEPRTGCDVYSTKFPTFKGWKVCQGYLLIIKTELLSKGLKDGLTMLCGEGDYRIDHRAKGEDKFGGEYEAFVENAAFDKEFLDRMYGSKYARHFYSPKQIAALRKKWS